MVGRMIRPIAVLAMAGALLAATPLAASAVAPPATDVRPAAQCNANPPPAGFSYVGSYAACGECQVAALRWESAGWRAHCRILPGSGRVDLYISSSQA